MCIHAFHESIESLLLRSLVLQTIPKHMNYNPNDSMMLALRSECVHILSELEALKDAIKLNDLKHIESAPFKPRRSADAVKIQAGHVPGLTWDHEKPVDFVLRKEDVGALDALGTSAWEEAQGVDVVLHDSNSSSNVLKQIAMPDLSWPNDLPMVGGDAAKHVIAPQIDLPKAADASHHQEAMPLKVTNPPPRQLELEYAKYPDPYAEMPLGPQELGVSTMEMPDKMPDTLSTCHHEPTYVTEVPPPAFPAVADGKTESSPQQIRDVHISCGLMDEFLRYAIANTRKGIETCGILAGSLSADEGTFTITALIVPKQEGTTDTVQALAEEEIFEAQDSRSLYPLGWIHTHPTQTCFLSSVDVHTQCGYQTMLDEAIAIVMAPTDAKTPVGIFRLTTPGGLKLIQNCPLRGFHAHPPTHTGQSIYDLCNHVYLNPRVGFEVIDLR